MPIVARTEELRIVLAALVAGIPATLQGEALLRRLLHAAANDTVRPCEVACAPRRALILVGREFRAAGAMLRRRPDVGTVADALELAGDHLEVLEADPITTAAPGR